MKTSFHHSLIAAVFAAVCVAPAAFAKPHPNDQQQPEQGPPGAPGNSGKNKKKGKGSPQPSAVPQNGPGNVGQPAGGQGPGPGRGQGIPNQGGPGRPGITVVIPPRPMVPPPPDHRSYRRGATYVTDNNVSAVQSALKQRGYYRGPVDGDAGPGTRGAIIGFRGENGLGSSSRIDGPLLRALGL